MKIALIGLDGSGKSANINLMKKDSDYTGFKFCWVRWQPSITVFLYKIKHKNDTVGIRQDNGANNKKYNTLKKNYDRKKHIKKILFKNPAIRRAWMYYAIKDYKRQFTKKINGDVKSDIVFDRYYLDLFVDQGINFEYSPEQIYTEIVKYQKYFPVMDKIIYVKVSPEVCYARKDDIPSMEYLKLRYEVYEYIAKKQNWLIIDGEQSLEDVYASIKKVIFS